MHTSWKIVFAIAGIALICIIGFGRVAPFKSAMTTFFWIGEGAGSDNNYISNTESYWDDRWADHYGGVDDPNCRNGYHPCGFTPQENPFYVALPYGEYMQSGDLKNTAKQVLWYSPKEKNDSPLLKNHWIEVKYHDGSCYGQWEDVGPNGEDDFSYVFGSAEPTNRFGEHAGLDISPALRDCLGMTTNDVTRWRFVDASDVPDGPWKEIVTVRGISWR